MSSIGLLKEPLSSYVSSLISKRKIDDLLLCFGLMVFVLFMGISTSIAEVTKLFLLTGLFLKFFYYKELHLKDFVAGKSFLLFLILTFISAFFSYYPETIYSSFYKTLIYFGYFCLFYFVAFGIQNRSQLHLLLYLLFFSLLINSIYSFVQYEFHWHFPEEYFRAPITETGETDYSRTFGFNEHANHFASILGISLFIGLSFIFMLQSKVHKILISLALLIILISLLMNQSRVITISFFLLAPFYLISIFKTRFKYILLGIGIIALLAAGLVFMPQFEFFRSRLVALTSVENFKKYEIERYLLWSNGLTIVEDYPFFGIGSDNFTRYYNDNLMEDHTFFSSKFYIQDEKGIIMVHHYVHNTFMQIAIENGIPAAIMLMIMLLLMLMPTLKIIKKTYKRHPILYEDKHDYRLSVGILFSIIIANMYGLVEQFTQIPTIYYTIFFLGIGYALYRIREKEKKESLSVENE